MLRTNHFINVYVEETKSDSQHSGTQILILFIRFLSLVFVKICMRAMYTQNSCFCTVRSMSALSPVSLGIRFNTMITKVWSEKWELSLTRPCYLPEKITSGRAQPILLLQFHTCNGCVIWESIAGQCLFLSRIDSEINSLSLPTFNQPSHCCQLSYQNKNLICVIVSCMNLQWLFYAFGVRISSYGSTQPTPQYHLLASPTTTHSTHTHSIIQLARIIWD